MKIKIKIKISIKSGAFFTLRDGLFIRGTKQGQLVKNPSYAAAITCAKLAKQTSRNQKLATSNNPLGPLSIILLTLKTFVIIFPNN